jgi:hypothetical protein
MTVALWSMALTSTGKQLEIAPFLVLDFDIMQPQQKVPLRIGDELRIPGLPTHVMTYVGPLGPYGEDILDAPKKGVATLVCSGTVLNQPGRIVYLGQRGPESWQEQQAVRQRALQAIGVANKALGPNCEDISSFVRTGKPESPQRVGFLVLASLVGVVAALSARSS